MAQLAAGPQQMPQLDIEEVHLSIQAGIAAPGQAGLCRGPAHEELQGAVVDRDHAAAIQG